VETQSIGSDAVPKVTVIPRAQWDNAPEEMRVLARASFARSDFNEDNHYLLIFSVPSGEEVSDDVTMHTFPPGMRLIHDSVFTTLTADVFAVEVLRRERFPRKADIIVRLHGLVGAAHLNGREGALRARDPNNSERCTVRLDDGNKISVRSQNYETVQHPKLWIEEF
jgi:hypothetical protein